MKIDRRYVRIANNLAFALVGGFLFLSIWHLVAKDTSWAPSLIFGLESKVTEEQRNVAAEAYAPPFPPTPIRASQIPTLFKAAESSSRPRPRPRPRPVTTTPPATTAPTPAPRPATSRPSDPVLQAVNHAKALFDAERYDEAEEAFKKIVDKHKRLTKQVTAMFYKRGLRLAEKKQHEQAIDLYKRAMHFQFANSKLHEAMVVSCKALGLWDRVSYHSKKAAAYKKKGL